MFLSQQNCSYIQWFKTLPQTQNLLHNTNYPFPLTQICKISTQSSSSKKNKAKPQTLLKNLQKNNSNNYQIYFSIVIFNRTLKRFFFLLLLQVVLVGMGTCTAKGTAWTRRRWAQHCSTTVWAAAPASRSSATRIRGGATPATLRSWSPPPTSAHPTSLFPVTMVAGATLLAPTSTSPCQCSSRSLSTVPESSPSPIAGESRHPSCEHLNWVPSSFPFACVLGWMEDIEKNRENI